MKTIHKFYLEIMDYQDISMPKYATILTVQMQGFGLYVWAEVDTEEPLVKRRFRIIGTGNPMSDIRNVRYIGTVQERVFVWHVYEEEI